MTRNLGFKFEPDYVPRILNEFLKPLIPSHTRLAGPAYFLTHNTYMRNGWLILTGNELYIYQTKDAVVPAAVLILT